ncbi:hypothetical protein WR25_04182 [Diploscapter pachys]|uniref:Uncharacterized protein n=1 Tax=Diploscapter pachys TaxID=2018661 RepID=A0A2A2LG96_9BILA|nr:hypothetical protein WR25_04182 [Diploscapter pachys]
MKFSKDKLALLIKTELSENAFCERFEQLHSTECTMYKVIGIWMKFLWHRKEQDRGYKNIGKARDNEFASAGIDKTLSAFCIYETNRGDPDQIKEEMNHLEELTTAVTEKLSEWIDRTLELAWGETLDQHVRSFIRDNGPIVEDDYNKTSSRIKKIADEIGPKKKVSGIEDANILIMRHTVDSRTRLVDSKNWLALNKLKILEIIE